jgi:4-hydroxy-tetrahydrodipicolinate reductase
MTLSVVVAGTTGWTGSAVARGVLDADDLTLVGAVSRAAAGRDAGEALGRDRAGVAVSATLADALAARPDVVVDYTKPHVVKNHALAALAAGCHVVIGTSGLTGDDFDEIDAAARDAGRGVFASGNFSITAALMTRFALLAARHVADVEVIDYASAGKPDTPSGTGRELAERLSVVRRASTAKPVGELSGVRETRGGTVGAVQVHSVRMPGYVLSCEALFGAPDERLVIRHDAGSSAAPYVAGTLLAIRRVPSLVGLTRGLDQILE